MGLIGGSAPSIEVILVIPVIPFHIYLQHFTMLDDEVNRLEGTAEDLAGIDEIVQEAVRLGVQMAQTGPDSQHRRAKLPWSAAGRCSCGRP